MYVGEAVASVEAIMMVGRQDGRECLAVTDSMIWRDALVRGTSTDRRLVVCIMVLYLWVTGQLAIAHVPGEENVADGPSRAKGDIYLPRDLAMPVHRMAWSKCGATHVCDRVRWRMWEAIRQWVPCLWRTRVERIMGPEHPRRCVEGCRHTEV